MLVRIKKERVSFPLKKSIISCLAENILFSGVQFKIHSLYPLQFLSCLHMKFPLKLAESLGLDKTRGAEGILCKLAKTMPEQHG